MRWSKYDVVLWVFVMVAPRTPSQESPVKYLRAHGQDRAWYSYVKKVLEEDRLEALQTYVSRYKRYVSRDLNSSSFAIKYKEESAKEKKFSQEAVNQTIHYWKMFSDELIPVPHPDLSLEPTFDSSYTLLNNSFHLNTKEWTKFVDNFLVKFIKFFVFDKLNTAAKVYSFLQNGKQRSLVFCQVSKTTHQVYRKRKDCITANTLSFPLGRIMKQEKYPVDHGDLCDPCFIKKGHFHKSKLVCSFGWKRTLLNFHYFIFTLSKELKLKLQFHKLHIELVNFHICMTGNLRIENVLSGQRQYMVEYCGIHSEIPVFPPHKEVNITISLWIWVSHTVLFSFDVISSKTQIVSLSMAQNKKHTWSIFIPQKNKYIGHFKLATEKYNIINVIFCKLETSSTDIYNGPGALSQKTRFSGKGNYTTTTFQCQIVLLSKNDLGFHNFSQGGITYSFHPNSNIQQILLQSNSSSQIYFPMRTSSSNNSDICASGNAFLLHIYSNSNVNISVKMLQSQHAQSSACEFSGLAVYQENKTKQVLPVLCSESLININIYAEGPDSHIVLYSYPEYGMFYTELMLSATSCFIWAPNSQWDTDLKIQDVMKSFSHPSVESTVCAVILLGRGTSLHKHTNETKQFLFDTGLFSFRQEVHVVARDNVPTTATVSVKGYFAGLLHLFCEART